VSPGSRTSLCLDHDPVDIVALTLIDGFGPAATRAHLERIRAEGRSIDDALDEREYAQCRRAAAGHLRNTERIGARLLIDGDPSYPAALHDLEQPPVALWALGDLDAVRHPDAIAIVGTRGCTSYGERVARSTATAFVRCGAVVVSGMARGIDAAAHVAALDENGKTVAVLGTGVDVPYPASHRGLHARIRKHGLIVSESPPGARAIQGSFPRRNRIIAALAGATIVIEAGVKSGALITAGLANDIGRKVGVVPGPIDSAASLGSNLLMRDGGGHPITTIEDALALIGLSNPGKASVTLKSDIERAIWKALEQPAANFDVLCGRTGLPGRICLETVTTLEIRGLIDCSLTGEVRRR
jgi:DNA processing protein